MKNKILVEKIPQVIILLKNKPYTNKLAMFQIRMRNQ